MTDVDLANHPTFAQRHLGPYHIEEEIGAGSMGTVFRAIHTGLDRPVALKVLRPDMLQDADSVRRFLREARSSARLEHPHIVSVYDAGEIDGQYYIAMKLLEGQTLQGLLAGGPLRPDRVVKLGTQLASALDYAHGREVVHLDVKPANVIVSGNDQATLTDFSIAQALNPGATRSATIAGTPLYMSPEQIQGKELDSRSDIYSLGLLLYEMCVGHPPFQGQFVTVMYAHLHSPVPDIRGLMPYVPEALAQVIYRALSKDRTERYQTAGELLRAIERAMPKTEVDVSGTVRLGREEMEAIMNSERPPGAEPFVMESRNESRESGRKGVVDDAADKVARWRSPLVIGAGVVVALVVVFLVWKAVSGAAPAKSTPIVVARSYLAMQAGQSATFGHSISRLALPPGATRTVYAISVIHLKSTARAQGVSIRYVIDGETSSVGEPSSRLSLTPTRPTATVAVGVQVSRSHGSTRARYRIRLLVNGHQASSVHLLVT